MFPARPFHAYRFRSHRSWKYERAHRCILGKLLEQPEWRNATQSLTWTKVKAADFPAASASPSAPKTGIPPATDQASPAPAQLMHFSRPLRAMGSGVVRLWSEEVIGCVQNAECNL